MSEGLGTALRADRCGTVRLGDRCPELAHETLVRNQIFALFKALKIIRFERVTVASMYPKGMYIQFE